MRISNCQNRGGMMRREFTVSVEIPKGCSVGHVADYIRQAVRCWCGSKDPEDPIFDLNRKSIRVRLVPKPAPDNSRNPTIAVSHKSLKIAKHDSRMRCCPACKKGLL